MVVASSRRRLSRPSSTPYCPRPSVSLLSSHSAPGTPPPSRRRGLHRTLVTYPGFPPPLPTIWSWLWRVYAFPSPSFSSTSSCLTSGTRVLSHQEEAFRTQAFVASVTQWLFHCSTPIPSHPTGHISHGLAYANPFFILLIAIAPRPRILVFHPVVSRVVDRADHTESNAARRILTRHRISSSPNVIEPETGGQTKVVGQPREGMVLPRKVDARLFVQAWVMALSQWDLYQ
jgi:hypothetical protein